MFQLDRDGYLLHLNPAMARFLMYASPEEMLTSRKEPLWSTAVSPERHEEFASAMEEFGHVRAFELEIYRKDRSKIWISATVRAMVTDGIVEGFEGMFEDITERRLLREQLLQAQKLESVGQLAAGIAHEINTPMQYIGDNVRFLKKTFASLNGLLRIYGRLWKETLTDTVTPPVKQEIGSALQKIDARFLLEEIPKAIEDTLDGVRRVSSLVSAMKEFSHPGTREKTPLDLNRAIQSTIIVAQNEWKYVAEMETDFEPTLPPRLLPSRRVQPGDPQPDRECGSRDRRPEQRSKRKQGQDQGANWTVSYRGRDSYWRYRERDSPRHQSQDIRSVLHYQGDRQGHGAGTRHRALDHRGQTCGQSRLRIGNR